MRKLWFVLMTVTSLVAVACGSGADPNDPMMPDSMEQGIKKR